MSEKAIKWAFNQDVENASERAALTAIASLCNETSNECTTCLAELARITELNLPAIGRAIERLEEAGLVEHVTNHANHDEKWCLGSTYRLPFCGYEALGDQGHMALNWAMTKKTGKATNNLVLIHLAHRFDENPEKCTPTVGELADQTELSVRTVRRALQELEDGGYIERTLHFGIGWSFRFPALEAYGLYGG